MKLYLNVKAKELEAEMKAYFSKLGTLVDSFKDADIIVSIGGDGTLLGVAQKAVQYDKPLVGINAGHLGYLCAYKIEELKNLDINDFKNLKETKRTLIEYDGHIAINDICVLKGNPIQSIELDVKNIGYWKGDGVIVSTATGSSSYNLSAGGPLLDRESEEILVTPICPILPKKIFQRVNNDEIIINVSNRTPHVLSYDNNIIGPVKNPIIIHKSKKHLRLLVK